MKFEPLHHHIVGRPVFVVGINPGNQRKGEQTRIAWQGNKSADLVFSGLREYANVYLTNVCNYQEVTDERTQEGIEDLKRSVKEFDPIRIICFGNYPYSVVSSLFPGMDIRKMQHPSYVIRFNKNEHRWLENFKENLK